MSPLIQAVVSLLPVITAAQNNAPAAANQAQAATDAAPITTPAATYDGAPTVSNAVLEMAFNRAPYGPFAPQQQRAKAADTTARPGTRIPGSMVGYIDNAVVESEIRVRFDAAFDDQFPDRAEFIYAKCACYRGLQNIIPAAFDPNAPGPGPGVEKAINYQQLYLNAEYSPHRRFSGFVEVPIRWLQPQGFFPIPPFAPFSNQSGLGDVMAGIKLAAVATESTYLTFQFKSYFPSGDSSKGLGTNHYSVEPSLLLYHALSPRFTVEGQLGDWHPIGGSAGVPTATSAAPLNKRPLIRSATN